MVHIIYCVVLLSLIKLLSSAHSCKIVIKCADPLSTDGNCLERTPRDEIYFYNYTRCPSGHVCKENMVTGTEVKIQCIEKAEKKNLYDGQECLNSTQCHSNNCTNGICLGKKKGEKCRTTDECATRHYCKKNKEPDPPGPTPDPPGPTPDPPGPTPDPPGPTPDPPGPTPDPPGPTPDPPGPTPDPPGPTPDPPGPTPDPPGPTPDPPGPTPDPPGPFIPTLQANHLEFLMPLILPESLEKKTKESRNVEEGICTPQEKTGGECTEDYDCMNNALCGPDKQCIDYFSYENGIRADNEILCQSGRIGEKTDGSGKVCVDFQRVEKENECKKEQTSCTYKATGELAGLVNDLTLDCECSYGNPDVKYCPYDPSSQNFKDYWNLLKEYYRVEAHDYHTKLRNNTVDPQLKRKLFVMQNYPKYFNVSDCAVEFGLSSSFVTLSYGLFLFLLAFLI